MRTGGGSSCASATASGTFPHRPSHRPPQAGQTLRRTSAARSPPLPPPAPPPERAAQSRASARTPSPSRARAWGSLEMVGTAPPCPYPRAARLLVVLLLVIVVVLRRLDEVHTGRGIRSDGWQIFVDGRVCRSLETASGRSTSAGSCGSTSTLSAPHPHLPPQRPTRDARRPPPDAATRGSGARSSRWVTCPP